MSRTERKSVIVTGGGQGIGRGIALRLVADGMAVVIADCDEEAGRETAADAAEVGEARFIACDVSCEASVASLVESAVKACGRLDAMICNAGLASPGSTPPERMELAQWQRIIDTNLTGVFLCAKHAVPHLRKARGSIVTIASTRGLQSEPNTEAYSASKGGVLALTHALAMSLGPDVRVNCISPGWIDTTEWKKRSHRRPASLRPEDHRQHPCGRAGVPPDIAAMTAFLISDEAGFITGQNFVVDGGMVRRMIYVE